MTRRGSALERRPPGHHASIACEAEPQRKRIAAYIDQAPIGHLVGWLVDAPAEGGDSIWCPSCQDHDKAHLLHGPAAEVIGALEWVCRLCGERGTVFGLAEAVLADADAVGRIVEWLDGAG